MCGIAGYALSCPRARPVTTLGSMCMAMSHRGPDDEGIAFVDTSRPPESLLAPRDPLPHDIALGHRRFSIIDPGPEGHQPFWSDDRRLCLTFNGEIYNHIELRGALEKLGAVFRTRTDTEVLLQAYKHWGTDAFERLRGFWAVAVYDASERAVLLSRDPLGQAPLYYAPMDDGVAWASEIKALRGVARESAFRPRAQAIDDFVRHGWRDLDNRTSYDGVRTLQAGCWAWVRGGVLAEPSRYWQLPTARMTESDVSPADAIQTFRDRFHRSVERRLRADVPLAFELSGGMDSSSIVAAAVGLGHKVTTYTVKFDDARWDEEPYARTLKNRYGDFIDYHIIRPPDLAFWQEANAYVAMMDEPFHSPNMLTNRTVWAAMAEQGIRVSLNGAAGDELLAGYSNDYAWPMIARLMQSGHPLKACRELFQYRELPCGMLALREVYRRLRSARGRRRPVDVLRADGCEADDRGPHGELEPRLIDLMGNWRMNYWLRSAHQSFMSVPIEVRAPFLDVDLVDFTFRLPVSYLIRNGWHKWILRKAMEPALPAAITWRKRKMGFPFPLRTWLEDSKNPFFRAIGHSDCPFIDQRLMRDHFDHLAATDPNYLWRAMSVSLWWKRCVLAQGLE